ncbi:MAG: zf-TFIIB domain-containing protein [Leptospiraceae bacterium]|nr:zf-TFIIB domain-containing protein [Leptospiraceae bacterium]
MSEKPKNGPGGVPLKTMIIQGVDIEYCPKSQGIFLHKGELNKLLHLNAEEGDLEFSSADHIVFEDKKKPVVCYNCGETMKTVKFLEFSDVILDHCPACQSNWLDKGELEAVQKYWGNLESGAREAHDPIMFQFLNFLKAVTFPFIAAFFIFTASLHAQDALSQLKSQIGGMFTSFSANFSVTGSGGSVSTGKVYYQYPNQLHVSVSGGGIIATNGKFLWLYNPSSGFCARQDVGGSSGGVLGLLGGYEGSVRGGNFVFKNPANYYSEIIVTASNGMLRSLTLRHEDQSTTYAFTGVNVGGGARASLFNFKPPPNAQMVENPLNR